MEALGALYVFGVLFVFVLAICWIILPFALIGTKPILRDILKELRKLNGSAGEGLNQHRSTDDAPRSRARDQQERQRA